MVGCCSSLRNTINDRYSETKEKIKNNKVKLLTTAVSSGLITTGSALLFDAYNTKNIDKDLAFKIGFGLLLPSAVVLGAVLGNAFTKKTYPPRPVATEARPSSPV